MRDLDLPRGDERELVVDRDRVYDLDGEDSRALAAVGAFRIVPEHDLDLPHDTLHVDASRGKALLSELDHPCIEVGLGWLVQPEAVKALRVGAERCAAPIPQVGTGGQELLMQRQQITRMNTRTLAVALRTRISGDGLV